MSIYTTIVEFGPENHNKNSLLGPNSIMVVYTDPLGDLLSQAQQSSWPQSLRVLGSVCFMQGYRDLVLGYGWAFKA